MEILFKGAVVEEPWYGECPACSSIMRCEREEIPTIFSSRGMYGILNCPICGYWVYFYPEYTGSGKNIKNKLKK